MESGENYKKLKIWNENYFEYQPRRKYFFLFFIAHNQNVLTMINFHKIALFLPSVITRTKVGTSGRSPLASVRASSTANSKKQISQIEKKSMSIVYRKPMKTPATTVGQNFDF